jgi:hypothetical protein
LNANFTQFENKIISQKNLHPMGFFTFFKHNFNMNPRKIIKSTHQRQKVQENVNPSCKLENSEDAEH